MKLLHKIEKIIFNIELVAVILLLLSLSVFSFCQVILRNFFDYSVLWMAVYNSVALLVLTLLGATIATASFERSHINIDLVQGFLKFPYNKYVSAFITLIAAAACLTFVFFSWHFVQVTMQVGKDVTGIDTPEWVVAMVFPVCFASMSFKFFVSFLTDLQEIRRKEKES